MGSLPEWVNKWLKLPFHDGEKCTAHGRHKTVYCITCMEDAICEKCCLNFQIHKPHHHQILKVLRCSRRVAVEVKDIRKLIDVSEIQVYSINCKTTVYLNPSLKSSTVANQEPYCQTCHRKIIKSDYSFCSIACKIEKKRGCMVIEKRCESWSPSSGIDFVADDEAIIEGRSAMVKREISTVNMRIINNTTDHQRPNNPLSFRKRSRKGKPQRAPFY